MTPTFHLTRIAVHLVRRLWLCLVALLLCLSVRALDPNLQVSQYGHTAWRIQDGFFNGAAHAIAQTKDGYLWIGTDDGLVRFDGVRFVPWAPPSQGKRLPNNRVESLLGASDGSLWIGTSAGLAHWTKNGLATYPSKHGFIEAMLEDPQGVVWFTRAQVRDDRSGGFCRASDSDAQCYGASAGIPFYYAQPMAQDNQGNFWIGSSLGICRWSAGSASAAYLPDALKSSAGLAGVGAISANPDGSLLVGMVHPGKGLGLEQFVQGVWKNYVVEGLDGSTVGVTDLMRDRDNVLWVGTQNQGIYRIYNGKAEHFSSADGLSSDAVNRLYEDREGDVWVATEKGLDRFRNLRVATYSIREGLSSESVGAVSSAPDGTLWISNGSTLDALQNGTVTSLTARRGLPGNVVTALFVDREDHLWVGINTTLTVYADGHFTPINKADGTPLGVITAITEDSAQNIWVETTAPALYRVQDRTVREEILPSKIPRALALAPDPKDGIWIGLRGSGLARYRQGQLETFDKLDRSALPGVRDLLIDSDGSVWGATPKGLLHWKNGNMAMLTARNGLPCDAFFALVKDDAGSLWLGAECGYISIPEAELQEWSQQPSRSVNFHILDVFDGAQTSASNFRPAATRTADGRLWFATDSTLQMIDPTHLAANPLAPPVQIERVIADRKVYAPQAQLRIPPRTRDIEIDYTALSFMVPQRVNFRYKLDGQDSDWRDPQGRRQAFYNDLSPGTYHFHVIASQQRRGVERNRLDARLHRPAGVLSNRVVPRAVRSGLGCFALADLPAARAPVGCGNASAFGRAPGGTRTHRPRSSRHAATRFPQRLHAARCGQRPPAPRFAREAAGATRSRSDEAGERRRPQCDSYAARRVRQS